MPTRDSVSAAQSRAHRPFFLPKVDSSIELTRCNSRFISRCAVKLADANYSRIYSPDEWAITHNRAIQVLDEESAGQLVGEYSYGWSDLCMGVVVCAFLAAGAWVWGCM